MKALGLVCYNDEDFSNETNKYDELITSLIVSLTIVT